jgi:hypothetical protein
MSFPHFLIIIALCLAVSGAYAYIRDTLTGKTKPNRVSWALWALAPLVAVYIGHGEGADPWVSARTFVAGFGPLLILLASFWNPKSYWKLELFDYLCGAMALVAFYFWLGADSPRTAIVLLAIADLLASMPIIIKAWRYPETETAYTFIIAFIISVITIPAIPVWNIENAAFPVYLLIANSAILFALYRKKIFRSSK